MRYHYEKPDLYFPAFGQIYKCNHPVYSQCTFFIIGEKGLAIIQQRYNPVNKTTWWTDIDPWLINELYMHPKFKVFFDERSGPPNDGLYPTVSIRQIMWALKMKPIKRNVGKHVLTEEISKCAKIT